MSARRRPATVTLLRSLAAATAVVICVAGPVLGDDAPTEEAAIERARALVRQGDQEDAEAYLAELTLEGEGPHAGSAAVLLEAARLVSSADDCRAYATRAIERTRSGEMLEAAHMLIGDSYFAERLYLSASLAYEEAARHSPGRGPGTAALMRARSILASGDAGAAAEAYREIAEWGATPTEITPRAELGLARSLLEAGRPGEAAEQFGLTARVYEEPEIRAAALAGAADSHVAAGEPQAAADALRDLLECCPDTYEAVLAQEHLRRLPPPDSLALPGAAADSTTVPDGAASPSQ
jgi:hypothetical protein